MKTSPLASLREVFANKKLSICSTRNTAPKPLNCRQRLQKKYEPSLPTFSSFFEEIEWRLSDISSSLFKGDEVNSAGLAPHWIKVAIFAGYRLDRNGYLITKSKKNPPTIHLVPQLRLLWEEVFIDCLIDIRLGEIQCLEEKKTFLCVESNGKRSLIKATDLFDLVDCIFGVGNKIDSHERKRCLSMLKTLRSYKHFSTRLSFQTYKGFISITQNKQFGFYEVVVKEQV